MQEGALLTAYPWTKAIDLFGVILAIGIRAIVIATIIEIALFLVAFSVGVLVWINGNFLTGFATGLAVYIFGQGLVSFILDIVFQLPEGRPDKATLPSDDDVLESLRSELTKNAEQDAP